MRLTPFFVVVLLLGLGACTNTEPEPIYIEMDYQVRCVRCEPVAPSDPHRDVRALPGDDGMDVRCQVDELNGDRRMTMSAVYVDPEVDSNRFALEISQMNLEGGPGGSCQVKVIEGSNTYEGGCTSDDPSGQTPCKIDYEIDGVVIRGTMFCENIKNALADTTRHVTTPGSDTEAFEWEVWNCSGL